MLGRPVAEVIVPERRREAHRRWIREFPITGSSPMLGRLVESTALTASGEEIPVELAVSVAEAPEGNIFVGHVRDISARREAEAARLALEAQLRQAQKMEAIGQLTGGIAHDFNNILTSVIGYLVLGEERAEGIGDAVLLRQLGQAHLAAQRARDLIAQMLAFARRQRGEARVLDMAPLVRQTLRLLRATLPSSVTLGGNAGVDDLASPLCVAIDPVQLEQVLFNLCINARDALDGAGRISVDLRAHAHERWQCASCRAPVDGGPWVELSVADSGSGIAPELLERIFDPFFSTKAPGSGSGMGLAMVHGIVHGHGGHLRVRTAPGTGSVFSVMLPRAAAAPARLLGPGAAARRRGRGAGPARQRAGGGGRSDGGRLPGRAPGQLGPARAPAARAADRGGLAGRAGARGRPAGHRPDHAAHDRAAAGGPRPRPAPDPAGGAGEWQCRRLRPAGAGALRRACAAAQADRRRAPARGAARGAGDQGG